MDDFLHNLRTGKNKSYDRNRKPYDNTYKSPDRQNIGDNRRRDVFQKSGSVEHLTAIKKLLEDLTETQKRLIEIEEKRAVFEERIAAALEMISMGAAARKPEQESPTPQTETETAFSETPDEDAPLATELSSADTGAEIMQPLGKEQLVEMISAMRKEQMSFEKIAKNLEQQGISTLSGKGVWRGQAVAKLCQQINAMPQDLTAS